MEIDILGIDLAKQVFQLHGADRAYDHDKYRRPLHAAGIPTSIARRGQPHGSGLGKVSAGSSSVLMPGCTHSVVCAPASSVARTFTKLFSSWPVASSAGAPFSVRRLHFEMSS